jgi:hypothetical protein
MKNLTTAALKVVEAKRQEEQEDEYRDDEEYNFLRTKLPRGVDIREALEYGFFEYQNRYWLRRKSEFEPVSNFTIRVLYLIRGVHAKRIVEITNYKGKKAVIDFAIEDLISVEKFKCKVESEGNFLFEGKASDLARIKNKLFSLEKPSLEIQNLGQQKGDIFAFANGLYHEGSFHEVDENGMCTVGKETYFVPVFGATQDEDSEDLRNYRKFLHRRTELTFSDWAAKMVEVYGDNGKVAVSYALYALFSDIVFEKTRAAPMLFLFGQRGSGKGTLANSIMALWGVPQDPIMLGGASTVVGFMRKLAQFRNALVWLDEYKNDIDARKIESLKNIWDRIGYERGAKDQSVRTTSTPVTSSAIVSGQEIPNAEPALFSRMCLLEFHAAKRTQAQTDAFDALRAIEDEGITSVTLQALTLRGDVRERFFKFYTEIAALFRKTMQDHDIIDRQITNYSILVSVCAVVGEKLQIPFGFEELMVICGKLIIRQKNMMRTSNEVQQFWEMLSYLLSTKAIRNGTDVQVSEEFVKVRMSVVYPLYREAAQRQRSKVVDRGTLENYLESSLAYCESESKKGSHRFKYLQVPTTCKVYLQKFLQQMYGVNLLESLQVDDIQPVM